MPFSPSRASNSGTSKPVIAGVIAEYNPFHTGHLHHLDETRRYGADFIIVVMSTVFTQRGEAALLPVSSRVRQALYGGADAVIALPAIWAVRDAEHFALGGVGLLSGLGCDLLSFGSEIDDLPMMLKTADLLEHPTTALHESLHEGLSRGLSYPAALHHAVMQTSPDCAPILASSNSTLALCYLRQLKRLNSTMRPLCIRRNSSYRSVTLDAHAYPSATAVRSCVLRGDWTAMEQSMPKESADLLRYDALQGRIMRQDALDSAILYRLRTMSRDEWLTLPDQAEGLPDRLHHAARTAGNLEEVLKKTCTRRYTRARMQRLICHALLGLTGEKLPAFPPTQALLLGLRKGSEALLHELGPIPVIGRASELKATQSLCWETEARAWDIWSIGIGQPCGALERHGVIRI